MPAPKDAELVYKAKLNVLPVDAVKLCTAVKISVLNVLHIADDIARIFCS